jgi:hypothetical protein
MEIKIEYSIFLCLTGIWSGEQSHLRGQGFPPEKKTVSGYDFKGTVQRDGSGRNWAHSIGLNYRERRRF